MYAALTTCRSVNQPLSARVHERAATQCFAEYQKLRSNEHWNLASRTRRHDQLRNYSIPVSTKRETFCVTSVINHLISRSTPSFQATDLPSKLSFQPMHSSSCAMSFLRSEHYCTSVSICDDEDNGHYTLQRLVYKIACLKVKMETFTRYLTVILLRLLMHSGYAHGAQRPLNILCKHISSLQKNDASDHDVKVLNRPS